MFQLPVHRINPLGPGVYGLCQSIVPKLAVQDRPVQVAGAPCRGETLEVVGMAAAAAAKVDTAQTIEVRILSSELMFKS